jgi:hypothetical protein
MDLKPTECCSSAFEYISEDICQIAGGLAEPAADSCDGGICCIF